jgi:hypothetical protein
VEKDHPILKRASASRPSGEWNDDDFDALAKRQGQCSASKIPMDVDADLPAP